jgi:hypothetical protein
MVRKGSPRNTKERDCQQRGRTTPQWTPFLLEQRRHSPCHETVLVYRGKKDARGAVVGMKLAGSLDASAIAGGRNLPGIVNYLIGNDRSKWHTRIPTYAEVDNHEVYPGVHLAYGPTASNSNSTSASFRVRIPIGSG